jgi:hypothetical protein
LVVSKLYNAVSLGNPPAFDGGDCWPIAQGQLADPMDVESTTLLFPNSSVTGNLWASGTTAGTLLLPFYVPGFPISIMVRHARLSMQLDPNHKGATTGQLGGVLDTEEYIEAIRQAAGGFDPSLCQGATFESIATQIRQASDIMVDGTQDPLSTCNGISIGIGFKMKAAELSGSTVDVPPPPLNCP